MEWNCTTKGLHHYFRKVSFYYELSLLVQNNIGILNGDQQLYFLLTNHLQILVCKNHHFHLTRQKFLDRKDQFLKLIRMNLCQECAESVKSLSISVVKLNLQLSHQLHILDLKTILRNMKKLHLLFRKTNQFDFYLRYLLSFFRLILIYIVTFF